MTEVGVSINIRLATGQHSIRPHDWLLGTVVLGCCCIKDSGKTVRDTESNGSIRSVDVYSAVLVFCNASAFAYKQVTMVIHLLHP